MGDGERMGGMTNDNGTNDKGMTKAKSGKSGVGPLALQDAGARDDGAIWVRGVTRADWEIRAT